jgi:disulfide bond formation protein DsbB
MTDHAPANRPSPGTRLTAMIDRIALSRTGIVLALAGAVLALAAALVAQYWGGLQPCELCIWQRWAFAGCILLLLPGLIPALNPRWRAAILLLGSLGYATGSGIALFHAGVEQHWWKGLAGCSTGGSLGSTVADVLAQLEAAPLVRCDEIAWSLFGLSMAGWNVLYSLGLALFCLLLALRALAWRTPIPGGQNRG